MRGILFGRVEVRNWKDWLGKRLMGKEERILHYGNGIRGRSEKEWGGQTGGRIEGWVGGGGNEGIGKKVGNVSLGTNNVRKEPLDEKLSG